MIDITFAQDIEGIKPRPILEEITVLIPTLGRDLLVGCLKSIASGTVWPARLVVVDQSSSEKVAGWLDVLNKKGLPSQHICSSQRGAAAVRNRGLERITTRFVAFTDDDCVVASDWLFQLHTYLQAVPDVIFTGRVNPGGEGVVVSVETSLRPAVYTRPLISGEILYTGNMGCALDVFKQVGYFDEKDFLRSAEDNDWCYRALRTGITVRYEPSVAVTHLDWRNGSQLAAAYRAYARSQGGVYGKYLRRGDLFVVLRVIVALGRAARRWLLGIIRGDQEMIDRGKAFLLELPSGIVAGWRGSAASE